MQIYADVLGQKIQIAASDQSVALGAAILGALSAEPKEPAPNDVARVIKAMAPQRDDLVVTPIASNVRAYDTLYATYRQLTRPTGDLANAMRLLCSLK
jgi:L-ribulokinase